MACSAGSSPAAVTTTTTSPMDAIGTGQQQHITKLAVTAGVGFESAGVNIMSSPLSPADDIIKMGILRKGRKGKKRFFVLHQETYGKPARLDCYESDKQYYKQRSSSSSGAQPKLSIPMKMCFNINKRVDSKLKNCIAVYTMDDVLHLGCDSQQEQEAWLHALLTVLRNTKCGFGQDDSGRLNYEHVWDVNIIRDRGLTAKNPSLSGPYRLCMTHAAIFLYRRGEDVHSLEFPLVFIASYGCKGSVWVLRVGRTAMTGSGQLDMETEDPIIAANINETMKSIVEENIDQRQRSTSTSDRRLGSTWGGKSSSVTTATLLTTSTSTATSSASLERSGSIGLNPQSRSRAISESEKTLQSLRSHLSHTRGGVYPVNMADMNMSSGSSAVVSPVSPASTSSGITPAGTYTGRSSVNSPAQLHTQFQYGPQIHPSLGASNAFCSNESVGTVSTGSEHDHSMSRYFPRQSIADRASSMEVVGTSIAEESSGSGAEYLPMQSTTTVCAGGDTGASSGASSTNTVLMSQRPSHIPEQQQQQIRGDTYMDMGIASDRRRMTADSGYLEMARANNAAPHLPSSSSSDQVANLSGYTQMGPGSGGRSSSSAHSRQTSWHLEEVRSYISDSDNSSCSAPPSRAWSLGSRPVASSESGQNGATYAAMGPATTASTTSHATTPSAGPITKFGLFLTSRLGGGSGSADDRKRAHSVGSWNKPPWKRNVPSHATQVDTVATPSSGVDPNAPSTSSSFYRPRSESFGSARSTPGSRRLLDGGGSKLSNQSEDLVEMEFGRSSIGRSPSGSLGSSESIARSRASSVGAGGSTGNASLSGGAAGSSSLYGRQHWSPRVEQITEQELILTHSPSGRLIQMFQQQLASSCTAKTCQQQEYVPMGASNEKKEANYCEMSFGNSIPTIGAPSDDYVAMSTDPKPSTPIDTGGPLSRQHSNPSSATSSYDPVAPEASASSATAKCPVRHSSGSSNVSLGNATCMGLDSGVGGSSFSLDQQKPDGHQSKEQHQQGNAVSSGLLVANSQKGRSLTNLSPMEQLKERLARVELAPAGRTDTNDDAYVQMNIPSTGSNPVRRSSSFAKSGFSPRQHDPPPVQQSSKNSSASQSPSLSRSPFLKMFASFGKGSSKHHSPSSTSSTLQHKSPTPSLRSASDSRSRTPSASSKLSLTDSQRTPAIVTASSSVETTTDEPVQLEYAALDLQQTGGVGGGPMVLPKTPSPRPSSAGAGSKGDDDGVVYAKIDAVKTSAAVESKNAVPR